MHGVEITFITIMALMKVQELSSYIEMRVAWEYIWYHFSPSNLAKPSHATFYCQAQSDDTHPQYNVEHAKCSAPLSISSQKFEWPMCIQSGYIVFMSYLFN